MRLLLDRFVVACRARDNATLHPQVRTAVDTGLAGRDEEMREAVGVGSGMKSGCLSAAVGAVICIDCLRVAGGAWLLASSLRNPSTY